jgi:hypothetical protein
MSLVLSSSPAAAGKSAVREAQDLAKSVGSLDDVSEHLFEFAESCIKLRLAIFKFIELDNIVHREMASRIADAKPTAMVLTDWNTAIGKAISLVRAALVGSLKVWKRDNLDQKKRLFGFSSEQLIEADTAAKEFIEALKD